MYSPNDLQIRGSRIHGLGVFAVRGIAAGTKLLPYLGKCIDQAEYAGRRDKTYCFALDDGRVVDGASMWNPAGFFNHSCEPNCESYLIDGEIWIVTRREIQPGEEMTFNYGYGLENLQQYPCRCGAPGCVGYIVAESLLPEIKAMRERGELPPG